MSLSLRTLPRLSPSLALRHLSLLPQQRPSQSRLSSTSTIPKATYYLQNFLNSPAEQYILLLPHVSVPVGRISLPSHRPTDQFSTEGPSVDFISSLSAAEIAENQHTFVENPAFRGILQDVVRQNIALEEMVRNEAAGLQAGEGWIHFCDLRQLPAYVPLPLHASSSRLGILWGIVADFLVGSAGFPRWRISLAVSSSRMVKSCLRRMKGYRLIDLLRRRDR